MSLLHCFQWVMYYTVVKYWWLLRKRRVLFHELHILRAPSSSLLSANTVFMPKKREKNGVSSKPETPVTRVSCLILPFWPQNVAFLENMTSDTVRRNALLVSKCLCWDATPQLFSVGKMGVFWKFMRRRFCAQKEWPQSWLCGVGGGKFWGWGRCPACPSQLLSSPWKGGGSPGLLRVFVRATPTSTGLQYAKNVFLSFSLPTVALADHLFCLLLTVINPGTCCFSSLVGSDKALLF